MGYEASFAIASLLISIQVAVRFLSMNKVSNAQSKWFILLLVDNGITAFSTVLRWAARCFLTEVPHWLLELSSFLYFITHVLLVFFMFLYLFSTIKIWRELANWVRMAIVVPIFFTLLVILSNPFTHIIYYYMPDGEYHRGSLIKIPYLCFVYYAAMILVVLFHYRTSFSSRRRGIILLVLTIGVGGALIQLFVPEFSVEVAAEAVSAVIMFLFIQNPLEQIDPELNVLTNLAFTERMKYNILAGKRFALIGMQMPELRDFENKNGEEAGNALLREMIGWLSGLSDNSNLYHIEKNSFALELIGPHEGEVEDMLKKLRQRFEEPSMCGTEDEQLSLQLLRLDLPEDVRDEQVLFGILDRFILSGQETRLMTIADFDVMAIKRKREINGALSRAMEKNNFELRYTPVYSQALERIVAAEVSLRFFDDELGYVYDDELFRFAQRSGHVLQLVELIFEQACRLVREQKLNEQGLSFLAVRFHPAMCLQYRVMERFREIMDKYEIDPHMLCLMISEYTVSTTGASFRKSINELEKTGVRICLEDYGSGFTNITSIFELPFSVMKINHSVMRAAMENEKARVTMDSTLTMARELDMMTMVEGIDDEDSFGVINDMACDLAKGNFFYEQVVEEEFLNVLRMSRAQGGGV